MSRPIKIQNDKKYYASGYMVFNTMSGLFYGYDKNHMAAWRKLSSTSSTNNYICTVNEHDMSWLKYKLRRIPLNHIFLVQTDLYIDINGGYYYEPDFTDMIKGTHL